MTTNHELLAKLHEHALRISKPFCYSCYELAPSGRCVKCGSDDLMRHVDGVGVEYGVEWIVKDLLESLTPVDTDEMYDCWLRDCYSETVNVCGFEMDPVQILRELDPVAYRCGKSDWEADFADNDELYFTIDGTTYYEVSDIEKLIGAV